LISGGIANCAESRLLIYPVSEVAHPERLPVAATTSMKVRTQGQSCCIHIMNIAPTAPPAAAQPLHPSLSPSVCSTTIPTAFAAIVISAIFIGIFCIIFPPHVQDRLMSYLYKILSQIQKEYIINSSDQDKYHISFK